MSIVGTASLSLCGGEASDVVDCEVKDLVVGKGIPGTAVPTTEENKTEAATGVLSMDWDAEGSYVAKDGEGERKDGVGLTCSGVCRGRLPPLGSCPIR